MDENQAVAAAAFANTSDELIVTCAGGVSRSVGVVCDLIVGGGGDDAELMRGGCPNLNLVAAAMRTYA